MWVQPWTLLRLYPRAWRERYGDEFIAVLEREGTGPRVVLNVLAGAFDAWVSPQVVDRYAPADANTLRFWRVQTPPDNRTLSERLPQIALAVAVLLLVKGAAALAGLETLDRAAPTIGIGVATIPYWYKGYSLRTKGAAAIGMTALMYGLTLPMTTLWP